MNPSNFQERKRKPRFTDKEVNILTRKIYENSDMIFSQFNDTVTNKKKKTAWETIQASVNATSVVPRSIEEIKKKWDDIKRCTKKRAIEVSKDRNKTGGGSSEVEPLSCVEEMVVSLIGEERVFGLPEGIDSFQCQLEAAEASTSSLAVPNTPDPTEAFRVESSNTITPCINRTPKIITGTKRHMPKEKNQAPTKIEKTESVQAELLDIERQRLENEKKRLFVEEKRLGIEMERLEELKLVSRKLFASTTNTCNTSDYSFVYTNL